MQTPAVIYFHLIDNAFLYEQETIRQASVRQCRRQFFILGDVNILSHQNTFGRTKEKKNL